MSEKHFQIGSISFILALIGIGFSFISIGDTPVGSYIFSLISIDLPYGIISIVSFTISILIGYKYKNDLGSALGKLLSLISLGVLILIFAFQKLVSKLNLHNIKIYFTN